MRDFAREAVRPNAGIGTVGRELYRTAALAVDADTVREGKKHIGAHPGLYHSINHSVTRYINKVSIPCVIV